MWPKMVSSTVFLVLFIISSSSANVLLENYDPEKSIIWPSEYNFNAEVIDLVNAHIETFEVWYSGKNNRSRIDYYNSTNKVYYVAESDVDSGYQYKIHPITTEEVKNEKICIKEERIGEQPDFLPVIEDYEYSHEEEQDGRQVRVWTKEFVDENDVEKKSTLYLYRTDFDFDVPFCEINKSLSLDDGAIQSYKITNYKQFKFTVDTKDVTPKNEDCNQDLNTPKSTHSVFKSLIQHLHPHNPLHVDTAFYSYKQHHRKNYKQNEHELRKAIFQSNWQRVRDHNLKNLSYKMELNIFADRTKEELKSRSGTRPTDPTVLGSMPFPHTVEELMDLAEELPESYDMRFQGDLGPVKQQGDCGSCWAFATVATIEGAWSKAIGGRNLDLSEQSLVDCAWGFNNYGCSGGWPHKAYEYVLKHGVPLDTQYGEYIGKDGYCKMDNTTESFKIRGFAKVTPLSPVALKVALVKYGPVAVTIYSSGNLPFYSNGVFYDIKCEGESLDHAVAVVGYGVRAGTPYWVVRNSWGENWGQDGYILMSALNNNCLVLDAPFFPII